MRGEAIASKMWKPVLRSHRVTVEQMAMLEPVLSETIACTCAVVMREAMDESIRRGVPAEAARDFLMGHINIALAVAFDEIEWDFSAGARMAIEEAKKDIFQPDWKKVFEPESLRQSVANITGDVLPVLMGRVDMPDRSRVGDIYRGGVNRPSAAVQPPSTSMNAPVT